MRRVSPTRYRGTALRHLSVGYPDPLSGEGARIHGGRYNPPGSHPTLYLCTTRECVVAEASHAAERQALAIADLLPREFYRYCVDLSRVLDLTDEPTRRVLAVDLPELTGDWKTTQAIGLAAYEEGFHGILSPSALGVDRVLAVFIELTEPGSIDAVHVGTARLLEDFIRWS